MRSALNLEFKPLSLIEAEIQPHWLRFIGYGFATLVLGLGIARGFFSEALWWTVVLSSLYPIISHYGSGYFRNRWPDRTTSLLIMSDTSLAGGAIVFMSFNPLYSLLLFLVVSSATMTLGGMRGWLVSLASMLFGFVFALIVFGVPTPILGMPDDIMIIIPTVVCGAIVTLLGFFAHRQARSLIRAQKELEKRQEESSTLSRKLAKYLPPQVWGSIFSGQTDVKLQTQRKPLSIFFSDIKGFTEITEELQPEALTELLNSYFTEMSRIALKYGGTIDKFIGDAILIFFGDPHTRGPKQDAVACVSMAIEMRKRTKALKQVWMKMGVARPLQVRIGINVGYCTVGNFGAESRMDYTIVGKEVNLASRLESLANPGEILISESTYNLIRDVVLCKDRGEITVKGFTKPVPIFEVVDLRKDLGAAQSYMEFETDGFSMYLDIDKIRNYEKDKVIAALESAAKRVKEKLIV
jgi:adenylate cyclase